MSQTKAGAAKAQKTIRKLYGKHFFKTIGALGGKQSRGGGFASMPREKISEAGRKGGSISRRGKK